MPTTNFTISAAVEHEGIKFECVFPLTECVFRYGLLGLHQRRRQQHATRYSLVCIYADRVDIPFNEVSLI